EIERILKEFAQEKFAFKIAKEIVKEREKSPIRTTLQLVKIIERVVGEKRGKIHPATKTFLALRIFVNEELENLKEGLKDAFELLNPGGKIAVISFHSGEDKIVKNFFKTLEKDGLAKILTKKPITPQPKEIAINPKSRSAKLRVIQKIK
ncbi:16S rRNA (cytosine(1402)-N(4))-methyltransferase, partial [Candidatus Parcubacteria bacterium]|nr:16S rRNA (cytosine(1402)-N(4))-methyltransferase [Candidatus Parcubacteria bacterium]